MSLAVASRYARALVDILYDSKSREDALGALEGLRGFQALMDASPELRSVLTSPAVPARKKRAAVARLADQLGFSPLLKNFLYVLIDHRRIEMLGSILSAVERLIDERQGIVRAAVTSARPLDQGQRAEVEAALGSATGRKVIGQYAVDHALIGGLTARVGSRVYDGSVRGQLQAMRSRLVRS